MEAEVISLDSKRKKPELDLGPEFYCLRCETNSFRLYASGVVHCGSCGAMMRNLFITRVPEVS